jgi:hypothetical protein
VQFPSGQHAFHPGIVRGQKVKAHWPMRRKSQQPNARHLPEDVST